MELETDNKKTEAAVVVVVAVVAAAAAVVAKLGVAFEEQLDNMVVGC